MEWHMHESTVWLHKAGNQVGVGAHVPLAYFREILSDLAYTHVVTS